MLWHALVQGIRGIAPVMPFLAEHLWRNLVAEACEGAPESVFLAGWPEAGEPDEALLDEIAEVRGDRRARATAPATAADLKLRQPLRSLVVEGAERALGPRRRDRRGASGEVGRLRAVRRGERPARSRT